MDVPNQNSLAMVLFMTMVIGISWYSKHVMSPKKRSCPACGSTVHDHEARECSACGSELSGRGSGVSA